MQTRGGSPWARYSYEYRSQCGVKYIDGPILRLPVRPGAYDTVVELSTSTHTVNACAGKRAKFSTYSCSEWQRGRARLSAQIPLCLWLSHTTSVPLWAPRPLTTAHPCLSFLELMRLPWPFGALEKSWRMPLTKCHYLEPLAGDVLGPEPAVSTNVYAGRWNGARLLVGGRSRGQWSRPRGALSRHLEVDNKKYPSTVLMWLKTIRVSTSSKLVRASIHKRS